MKLSNTDKVYQSYLAAQHIHNRPYKGIVADFENEVLDVLGANYSSHAVAELFEMGLDTLYGLNILNKVLNLGVYPYMECRDKHILDGKAKCELVRVKPLDQ